MALKKGIIFLGGFLLIFSVSLTAAGMTIEGKVMEVQGGRAKIAYGGEYAPSIGDPCELGFEIAGDFALLEGRWKVVETGPDFIWVQSEGPSAGAPAPDYIAKISSPNPQKRSALEDSQEIKGEGPPAVPPTDKQAAAPDIAGTYLLYREGDMHGRVLAKMRIKDQEGRLFKIGIAVPTGDPARDWQGRGLIRGAEGLYDWGFGDGKRGRTTFFIDNAGYLHGQVRGSGINWDYVALRQEGPISVTPR